MAQRYLRLERKEEMQSKGNSELINTESTVQDTVTTTASVEIAALAYRLRNERGCPTGSPDEDWFRAELELNNRKVAAAAA
jgi:hypothetical protein